MKQHILKISSRTAWLCLEGSLIVLLILFASAGVFVWKMSQGPIDLGFARDTIETALRDEESGLYVELESAQLYWPDRRGPVLIGLRGVDVARSGRDGSALAIEEIDLDLSYRALILGKIRPVSLILRQPSISLIRKNGDLDLFMESAPISEKDDEVDTAEDVRAYIKNLVMSVADPDVHGISFLDRLQKVHILQARAVMRDLDQGLTWKMSDLNFSIENRWNNISVALNVGMNEAEAQEEDPSGLTISALYHKSDQLYKLEADLQQINPALFMRFLKDALGDVSLDMPISGKILAELNSDLHFQTSEVELKAGDGTLVYPDQFDAPITLRDFGLQVSYDGAAKTGKVDALKLSLNGTPIAGEGSFDFSQEGRVLAPVVLTGEKIPQEAVGPLYPKQERDGDAYEWLAEKISGGVFTDVKAVSTLIAQKKEDGSWDLDVEKTRIDFAFEGADVNYAPPLMPAKNTKGSGFFDLDDERLEIDGERAEIGDIVSTKSKLIFTEIMVSGGGYADMTFEASGPLQTALEYVYGEPVDMGKTLGFDPDKVKGNVEMVTTVKLPTKKDLPKEEVIVKIDATLKDILLPGVVEGLDLTGGPYALKVADGQYSVKGSGQLAGRDVTLDWMQYFDSAGKAFDSKVTAKISADEKLRDHFGVDLKEYISGPLPVDLTYIEKPNGDATIDLTGDLNPLTIHINPFLYRKEPGVNGDVSLKAILPKGTLQEIRDLKLSTSGFSLKGAHLFFKPMNGKEAVLSRGKVQEALIGKSKAVVDFEITPQNVLKAQAKGDLLDASPFMDPPEEVRIARAQKKKEKVQPMIISAEANKMITKNGRHVNKAKTYLKTDTDGDITHLEVDARAGQGDIYIRFKPDAAGKRTFRLEADDAGAALYAADLYENARGGTLLVYGEPQGADMKGDLFGVARMENFAVVKAPVLAQILNAMSLGGMQRQLDGQQGLPFEKLESEFEWRFRDGGNLLVVKDGATSGSSIGLTFEGTIDQRKNYTNIGGTIVPMSGLNNFIGSIPLIGDILTGGGALIAATYSFKGPMGKPEVFVNPLSFLTPGIIRKVLFEGGYSTRLPGEKEEKPPAKSNKPTTRSNINQ